MLPKLLRGQRSESKSESEANLRMSYYVTNDTYVAF